MFIQNVTKTVKGKTYKTVLLLESYREGTLVKHRTIANLSHCPDDIVENFTQLIKNKAIIKIEDLSVSQGKICGSLLVGKIIAQPLGITDALGSSEQAKFAMLQIIARVFSQGSRLFLANTWAQNHAFQEVLDIPKFTEDQLYDNLDWLAQNQKSIEKHIFNFRNKSQKIKSIFLYDITSSYLEGIKNDLSDFGYNRDKKEGKKQIVVGLMCDQNGFPVSVEVFKGNTSDNKTVINQLKKLKEIFGLEKVIFVGDKGMLKQTQIQDITSENYQWDYITTITKAQIETLLQTNVFQLKMFDNQLLEVFDGDIRYVLRKNPARESEMEKTRNEKIEVIKKFVSLQNTYLSEHKKAKTETALKKINAKITKFKFDKILSCKITDRTAEIIVNQTELNEYKKLDGCYVVKTNLSQKELDMQIVHDRYKDLSKVEQAFRTFKTGLEEIRPVYVRKELHTRGHVFVCSLAYMIVKSILDQVGDDFTKQDIVELLECVQYTEYKYHSNLKVKKMPDVYLPKVEKLLFELKIDLPK